MVNAAPHTKPLSTIYWNKRLCASLVPVQYLERSFFMSTTLNNQALVSYYYNGEQSGGSAASNMISATPVSYTHLESLTPAQRATYVTRGKNNEYVRRLNPPQYWNLLSDKTEFLRRFDGLHGRLWLDLRQAGFEEFEAFCQRNPLFVVKPLDGTCGRGIELLDASEIPDLHARYDECIQNGQLLVEQYVVQHEDLSLIHI